MSENGTERFKDVLPLMDGTFLIIGTFTWDITLNPGQLNEIVLFV